MDILRRNSSASAAIETWPGTCTLDPADLQIWGKGPAIQSHDSLRGLGGSTCRDSRSRVTRVGHWITSAAGASVVVLGNTLADIRRRISSPQVTARLCVRLHMLWDAPGSTDYVGASDVPVPNSKQIYINSTTHQHASCPRRHSHVIYTCSVQACSGPSKIQPGQAGYLVHTLTLHTCTIIKVINLRNT